MHEDIQKRTEDAFYVIEVTKDNQRKYVADEYTRYGFLPCSVKLKKAKRFASVKGAAEFADCYCDVNMEPTIVTIKRSYEVADGIKVQEVS